jgi:uncharacterized protein involved in exopolysaccharide biosynthesis
MKKEVETTVSTNGHKDLKTNDEKAKEAIQRITPYIKRLWQHKSKLALINSIIGVITVLFLLFITEPYYESNIVILPEFGSKSTSLGGLSDLASLAGVNLANGAPTEIYENLVISEGVLEQVLYKKFQTEKFSKPVNLIEYFEIEADYDLDSQSNERFLFLQTYEEMVDSRITTGLDRITKILEITVEMPESKLSAKVANEIVESLDTYIRTKRKSFATQQRFYIVKRIDQVKDTLRIVENELKDFRSKNRIVEQSPGLLLEQSRLLRNVEIQQAVFIELTKQLEIAKIDEIKDTPVINIREEAKESIIKAGPPRIKILIVILFFSIVLSLCYFAFIPRVKHYIDIINQNNLTKSSPDRIHQSNSN